MSAFKTLKDGAGVSIVDGIVTNRSDRTHRARRTQVGLVRINRRWRQLSLRASSAPRFPGRRSDRHPAAAIGQWDARPPLWLPSGRAGARSRVGALLWPA